MAGFHLTSWRSRSHNDPILRLTILSNDRASQQSLTVAKVDGCSVRIFDWYHREHASACLRNASINSKILSVQNFAV